MKRVLRIVSILLLAYAVVLAAFYFGQRSVLFLPTHTERATTLTRWTEGDRTIGYCREVPNPATIWLMMHGNAGQAANRNYVLPHMSEQDSLYVLEYPGYGHREGHPSLESMNLAASQAYRLLRTRFPRTPVCVLGESIGSGPACALALEKVAPDKIVLLVPFDVLANVASGHYPWLPVGLLLRDNWNNAKSLEHFAGPVQIFAAKNDTIIPIKHAEALARQFPKAQLITIHGGHNDWPESALVKIQR